jgi:long-chain acyl-CoA synthetase
VSAKFLPPVAELLRPAREEPDRIAMVADGHPWTCAQLAEQSGRLAAGLAAYGVAAGARIALQLYNTPDAVLALLACLRIGAIAVPLNTRLTAPELCDLIERTGPVLYFGEHDLRPRLASVPESLLPEKARFVAAAAGITASRTSWPDLFGKPAAHAGELDSDSPAILLPTSGSTGKSKIVIWSHRTLAALHLSGDGRGIGSGDVIPVMTPLMHGSGAYHLFTALAQHATVVLIHSFEPGTVLDAMQRHRITTLFGLPFMCAALAREQLLRPRDASTLRSGFVAGDACPAEIVSEFSWALGAPLRSFWAATEDVGATTAGCEPGPYTRVIPEATVRIVAADGRTAARGTVGEMLVSSPTTTPGYWNGPSDLTPMPDGVFHSGDLVREREPGVLEYVGRAKDIIVRGGSNISPSEIEQALRSHPAVLDAGVAGLPDPALGQRVGALVVLTPGISRSSLQDIRSWLGERLAAWKLPEHIRAVDDIPRNALTKIDRVIGAGCPRRTGVKMAGVPLVTPSFAWSG